MNERDSEDDERDDLEEDEEEESPPPPKAKSKAAASKASVPSKPSSSAPRKPEMMPLSRAIMIGVAALAVGGATGWFGHIQSAKAALRAADTAAPAGSGAAAGPCGAWQSKICSGTGEQSAACQEAKGAVDLLLPSTCTVALGSAADTLAKVKAGRASCEKLVSQICKDLEPGSKTCEMVKERTPSFPRERCDQMLKSYDKVIAELKQMDAQGGGMQMGGPRMQASPGMPPGGMPPGGMAHGGMPRITIPPTAPAAPATPTPPTP